MSILTPPWVRLSKIYSEQQIANATLLFFDFYEKEIKDKLTGEILHKVIVEVPFNLLSYQDIISQLFNDAGWTCLRYLNEDKKVVIAIEPMYPAR